MTTNQLLERLLAKSVLGGLAREEVPQIAGMLVVEGFDTPSLVLLAGLSRSELDDVWTLLEQAFAELDVVRPTRRAAVHFLAREVAESILAGRTDPRSGARRIWDLTLECNDERFPDLDPFIYVASEWDDRPDQRDLWERSVMDAARALLE